MCDNCDHQSDSGSSFIFGIFLGAVIGAVVAIYIYKNNKTEVFTDLKDKLEKYFSKFTKSKKTSKKANRTSQKISVIIPKKVESLSIGPQKLKKPQKMFVKK